MGKGIEGGGVRSCQMDEESGSRVLQKAEGSKEGFSCVRCYRIWRARLRKIIELHG